MDALAGLIKEMAEPHYLRTSNNTAKDRPVAGQASKRSPMGAQCGRALHPARLATPEIAKSGSHRCVRYPFDAAELAAAVSKHGRSLISCSSKNGRTWYGAGGPPSINQSIS